MQSTLVHLSFLICCCQQIRPIFTYSVFYPQYSVFSDCNYLHYLQVSIHSILHFCTDPVSPWGLLKFHFIICSNLKYSAFVWLSHLSALHEHSLRLLSTAACKQCAMLLDAIIIRWDSARRSSQSIFGLNGMLNKYLQRM